MFRVRIWTLAGFVCLAHTGLASAGFESPVTPTTSSPGTASDFDWSAIVRLFGGWDSNVELYTDVTAPANPALGGYFGGATLNLGFTKDLDSHFTLGGNLNADVVGYVDTMPAASIPTYGTQSDYDFYAVQPTVYLKYRTMLGDGTDVTLRGTYSFRTEKSKNEKGLAERSHQFMASATFDVPGPWSIEASLTHTIDDFNNVYPADPLSDRDGHFTDLGVGATYRVAHPVVKALHVRIAYQNNDAKGINWSYSGFAISGGADLHIHGPLDAKLNASFANRDYVGNFASQLHDRQNQQITNLSGQLIWHIRPHATADLTVAHTTIGGNDPTLTAKATRITAGVTIRLK